MSRVRVVVISTVLLLAITAGSAAAGVLVTSARIKDGTVHGRDVRDQSLTGADVRDGGLGINDFNGLEPGPKGGAGPQGLPGADGAPGLAYRSASRTLTPGQQLSWVSHCDAGETAIGGGVSSSRPDLVTIARSSPDGFHWSVEVFNDSTQDVRVIGWAMCMSIR